MIFVLKPMMICLSRAAALWTERSNPDSTEEHLPPETMSVLMRAVSEQLGEEVRVTDQRPSRTGCQTVWMEGRRPYIVKLALCDEAGPRLEENAKALAALARITAPDAPLSSVIPRTLHTGRLDRRIYSIETRLPGGHSRESLLMPSARDDVAAQGLQFLTRLQTLSRHDTVLDLETWNREFRPMIDAVGAFVKPHDPAGVYDRMARRIRDGLLDQRVPLVFAHGNYWVGNLLLDPARQLTGVIDWDSAVERGLPLVDLLYFLTRSESLIEKTSLGEAVTKWIAADLQPLTSHPMVEAYCREFAIPTAWLRSLFYYSWIQHLNIHVRYKTAALEKSTWLRRNLINVLAETGRWERSGG